MAPWCIYNSCLERAGRSGSGRDSVRGSVGSMNAELSRPDGLATVQSGRKQAQSRVCMPGFSVTSKHMLPSIVPLILGELMQAAWIANNRRHTSSTNCITMYHLLAD